MAKNGQNGATSGVSVAIRRSRSPNGFLGVGSIASELPIAPHLPHTGVSFRGVDHKDVCEEGGETTPLETLSRRLLS